ncbi:Uncharacterised protein [Mycobacteroides abscessus subsp. abscessus]|nr:Uncharacterised protein [Mycobacteroides abscessus subsp. abscessus]
MAPLINSRGGWSTHHCRRTFHGGPSLIKDSLLVRQPTFSTPSGLGSTSWPETSET